MKWQDIPVRDWRLIHRQVVWLGAAMFFAGLILLFSQGMRQYNLSELQPLKIRLDETRAAADAAQAALLAATDSEKNYRELAARGVIGNKEHRLAWVENLIRINKAHPELKSSAHFAKQRIMEQSEPSGGSSLLASRMKIRYFVAHEEQFSAMHRDIAKTAGWPLPFRCEINRIPENQQLQVDCEYDWVSIAATASVAPKGGAE